MTWRKTSSRDTYFVVLIAVKEINGCERDVINKQTNQINNAQIGLHCPICWIHANYFYTYTVIHMPLNSYVIMRRLYTLNL